MELRSIMKEKIIWRILLLVLTVIAILTVIYILFVSAFFTIHGESERSVEIESEEIQIE